MNISVDIMAFTISIIVLTMIIIVATMINIIFAGIGFLLNDERRGLHGSRVSRGCFINMITLFLPPRITGIARGSLFNLFNLVDK